MWWHIPIIPAFGRLRQEDYEVEAILGYIVSLGSAWLSSENSLLQTLKRLSV